MALHSHFAFLLFSLLATAKPFGEDGPALRSLGEEGSIKNN